MCDKCARVLQAPMCRKKRGGASRNQGLKLSKNNEQNGFRPIKKTNRNFAKRGKRFKSRSNQSQFAAFKFSPFPVRCRPSSVYESVRHCRTGFWTKTCADNALRSPKIFSRSSSKSLSLPNVEYFLNELPRLLLQKYPCCLRI
jgi:hypothetical protein